MALNVILLISVLMVLAMNTFVDKLRPIRRVTLMDFDVQQSLLIGFILMVFPSL